jgi:hypothetical protein
MKRPGFTVEKKNGINYDANHLFYAWMEGQWVLSFICSGILISCPIGEVKEIRFSVEGANNCNECDENTFEGSYD